MQFSALVFHMGTIYLLKVLVPFFSLFFPAMSEECTRLRGTGGFLFPSNSLLLGKGSPKLNGAAAWTSKGLS